VSVCTVRKILPPPGFDPWTVQSSDSLYRLPLSGRPLVININIKSYECSLIISTLAAACSSFPSLVLWPGHNISSLSFLLVSFGSSIKILEFKIGHSRVFLYTIYYVFMFDDRENITDPRFARYHHTVCL
jgi:hypothetical protein